MNVTHHVWALMWSNPYKPRPEGFPQIMLQVRVPVEYKGQGARCPEEINDAWDEMRAYGYTVVCHHEGPEPRRLPLETKQRIRRRNLWKRLLKKYPMFITDFYKATVEARAEYYGLFTAGEFADVIFARTVMGHLKLVQEKVINAPAAALP